MNTRGAIIYPGLVFLLVSFSFGCGSREEDSGGQEVVAVERGRFEVFLSVNGEISSNTVETVMSTFQGGATVVWLIEEGAQVSQGDLLARLDSSNVEREVVDAEEASSLAEAQYEGLTKASLPLEIEELKLKVQEPEAALQAEREYLECAQELMKEGLISKEEIAGQHKKLERAQKAIDGLRRRIALTRDHLHPAKIAQANAARRAARSKLSLARQQLESCEIRAPDSGTVVYKSIHAGGEYRPVRVGDTVYQNQPFMVIPKMDELIVRCPVAEAELVLAQPGSPAEVIPLAYPDTSLNGTVTAISSMAQALPGRPKWQKYFTVTIGLESTDPRLRMGMSVTARILSYVKENTISVPRRAVEWAPAGPACYLVEGNRSKKKTVKLGRSNAMSVEVLEGLNDGDRIELR